MRFDAFEIIGEERRGLLDRRPGSCVVVEIVRKKFRRKADKDALKTDVLVADPLSLRSTRASPVPARSPKRSSGAGATVNRRIAK